MGKKELKKQPSIAKFVWGLVICAVLAFILITVCTFNLEKWMATESNWRDWTAAHWWLYVIFGFVVWELAYIKMLKFTGDYSSWFPIKLVTGIVSTVATLLIAVLGPGIFVVGVVASFISGNYFIAKILEARR